MCPSSKPNIDILLLFRSRVDMLLRTPQVLPLPILVWRFRDDVELLLPLQLFVAPLVAMDDKFMAVDETLLLILLLFWATINEAGLLTVVGTGGVAIGGGGDINI